MKSVKVTILFFLIFCYSQLLIANPVKENKILKIPYSEGTTTAPDIGFQKNEPARFEIHTIARNETPYSIAKQYGITVEDIYAYNPNVRRFNRGVRIRIPRWDASVSYPSSVVSNSDEPSDTIDNDSILDVFSEISCQSPPADEYFNTTFNVALFLPLFIETNYSMNRRFDFEDYTYSIRETLNNDAIIEIGKDDDMFVGFYENSEEYLQFYEGALLAIDSMQKKGMRIRLNVYDTQRNPETVRRILSSSEFLNTDLIIGPVYPNEQRDVSAFSALNQVIMVSPLSTTDEVFTNPFLYQINPDRDYLFSKTAEMVIRDFPNSNFIIFKTGNYYNTPETRMVDLIREKFNSSENNGSYFMEYDFRANGIAGLRTMLSSDRENVIFIPSSNEGELSIGISNLNNLAKEYQITLIGTNLYPQYGSIQIDYFHNLKLTYVAPYWTDYENYQTVNYIEKFKHNFFTEPNNFGQRGHDVTFYFLNALKNYGRDFRNCLPELKVDLIQGNYSFEKASQLGGYVNHGVSVITYTRNYDVVRKRIDAL